MATKHEHTRVYGATCAGCGSAMLRGLNDPSICSNCSGAGVEVHQ